MRHFHVGDELKQIEGKITRKLLNAFYSLYMGMEALDKTIFDHCNSSNVKKLGFMDENVKHSVRDAFSALGNKHLSFSDSETINCDMLARKFKTVGFADRESTIDPTQKVRGRKPAIPSQSTPIKRSFMPAKNVVPQATLNQTSSTLNVNSTSDSLSKRSVKKPDRYNDSSSSLSKSTKKKTVNFTSDIDDNKGDENVEETKESTTIDDIFGSEDETDEDDEPVFEINCNEKGLTKFCHEIYLRSSALVDIVNDDKSECFFRRDMHSVMCRIIELTETKHSSLPFKPTIECCTACDIDGCEETPIRKCSHEICQELNFCPKHLEHSIFNDHIIIGDTFHDK